ncbi:MAG TPA: phosphonopyruvate decarboxylase [Solirubrobacteraceae bacterium]|nr:phosphonopyruvate decarboxylase [Solirubrobacteraceae bacterium]
MIAAGTVLRGLAGRGATLFTGVPCSYLTPLIDAAIADPEIRYVGATSEGEAAGIAIGAWLGGGSPVTMCQNSGLGNMVNPVTSLALPCDVPFVMLCTRRGRPGYPDEPQHEVMGRVMGDLLDVIGVEWGPFGTTDDELEAALERADRSLRRSSRPYCLVVDDGAIAATPGLACEPERPRPPRGELADLCRGEPGTRAEALERVLATVGDEAAIVATTGKTGRELFTLADRPQHFYQVGAMGCASAVGLGLALTTPRRVVVLDGDGAALMKLGNMATIGANAPPNLVHVLLDNGVHDSTGGQRTVSSAISFTEVAIACGYRRALSCDRGEDFEAALRAALEEAGPQLLHVRIRPGSMPRLGRPTVHPSEVARRFRAFASATAPVAAGAPA